MVLLRGSSLSPFPQPLLPGYEQFVSQFGRAVADDIRRWLPTNDVVLEPTPVAEHVGSRFLGRCRDMIHEGVYPRLVFHGTPAQNVQPICERGPPCALCLGDVGIVPCALCPLCSGIVVGHKRYGTE